MFVLDKRVTALIAIWLISILILFIIDQGAIFIAESGVLTNLSIVTATLVYTLPIISALEIGLDAFRPRVIQDPEKLHQMVKDNPSQLGLVALAHAIKDFSVVLLIIGVLLFIALSTGKV